MCFAITHLPNRPVLLVRVDVPFEDYQSSYRVISGQLAQAVAQSSGRLHIWIDARELDLCFSDLLLAMQMMAQLPLEMFRSASVKIALIGTHPLLSMAARRVENDLGLHLDHFESFDDAAAHLEQNCAASP
jgi:hypothetical protein